MTTRPSTKKAKKEPVKDVEPTSDHVMVACLHCTRLYAIPSSSAKQWQIMHPYCSGTCWAACQSADTRKAWELAAASIQRHWYAGHPLNPVGNF